MICAECGVETPGWNHNNRGLKCTNCMASLPEEQAQPEAEVKKPAKPAAKKKPAKKQ